jgi:hypothetical protein
VLLPEIGEGVTAAPTLEQRVSDSVNWFLDTVVGAHAKTFVAVVGAEGVGDDPEIEAILADADDAAARNVLAALRVDTAGGDSEQRAAIRAYGGLVKAAVREWVRNETLTREQVHRLLSETLLAIVRAVLPELSAERRR